MALELEWVLRGYYGFAAPLVLAVFDLLLGYPTPSPWKTGPPWCRPWLACAPGWLSPMPSITSAAAAVA
ncbi:MAG: hypothetical protein ACK535_13000 [Cyanobacteriota bacterium]